jgi:hypothetical protein
MEKPGSSIFKSDPISDIMKRVLEGNLAAIWRGRKNPRSGREVLRLSRFPTSASEANYPQRVKKNGA